MPNLLHLLEETAARGAEGLTPEARATLAAALRALQCPEGGFAGLDGRPDPYFSLFAWLSLRALGAACDSGRLCVYLATARRQAPNAVDALCADVVLAREGQGRPFSRPKRLAALFRGDARAAYGAFLAVLATGPVPGWAARAAWRRQRSLFGAAATDRLPTPRLAAGLALAALAGARCADLVAALEARRGADGGFVSAPGAAPDLLATAAARFAMGLVKVSEQARETESETAADLPFIEACWTEDGLFGASPTAERGDAEHTFYGLLALGTCRRLGASARGMPAADARCGRSG